MVAKLLIWALPIIEIDNYQIRENLNTRKLPDLQYITLSDMSEVPASHDIN